MIDLHTHTKHSDGTDSTIELLQNAQKINVNYLSITDHNTCNAYKELESIDYHTYYSGKLVSGIELNTKILSIPIEILGYNINLKKMQELVNQVYITNEKRQVIEVERLYEKCLKEGFSLPNNFVSAYDGSVYPSKYLHSFITQSENNKNLIDSDAWENSNIFYRKYMSNPTTMFFINMDDVLPDFQTTCDIVRQAEGLVFIPHIYEYRSNSDLILKNILENYKIDGIECYYTTFSKEQNATLLSICKERNLYISGGSDYHGTNHVNVSIGVGHGDLKVPDEIAKDWAHEI